MLAVLVWRVPSFDADEVDPRAHHPHRAVARRGRRPHAGRPWCSRALRWQKVLDALDIHAGLRHLLSHYLAGQFVSNVLPTTIGGDVLRVTRLSRETGESPNSFASVVLERLTGWLVLPIISVAGFLREPRPAHLGTATRVALGLGLRHAHRPRRPPLRRRRPAARRALRRPRGLAPVRSAPSTSASTACATTRARPSWSCSWASPTSSSWCSPPSPPPRPSASARPPGSPPSSPSSPRWPSPRCSRSASPASACGRARSSLFLGPLGVATEEAIALGLLLYLLNLGVSLLGAPAFAVGGRGTPAPAVTPWLACSQPPAC